MRMLSNFGRMSCGNLMVKKKKLKKFVFFCARTCERDTEREREKKGKNKPKQQLSQKKKKGETVGGYCFFKCFSLRFQMDDAFEILTSILRNTISIPPPSK